MQILSSADIVLYPFIYTSTANSKCWCILKLIKYHVSEVYGPWSSSDRCRFGIGNKETRGFKLGCRPSWLSFFPSSFLFLQVNTGVVPQLRLWLLTYVLMSMGIFPQSTLRRQIWFAVQSICVTRLHALVASWAELSWGCYTNKHIVKKNKYYLHITYF